MESLETSTLLFNGLSFACILLFGLGVYNDYCSYTRTEQRLKILEEGLLELTREKRKLYI